MKDYINAILRMLRVELRRFPSYDHSRRMKLMTGYRIDHVLDVGANKGQYSRQLREIGYKGRIDSFEPLKQAFKELSKNVSSDASWKAHNYGLGNSDETLLINVSGNSESCSFMNMFPKHLEAAPESEFIEKQKVVVKKLDSIIGELCSENDVILLKLDVQGYEMEVFKGALKSLNAISMIQIELSLQPMYENETPYLEMIEYLNNLGFTLVSLEPGFSNPKTGELHQFDGFFVRSKKI
ncbi:MAG: FkbM family methyltransferase [bacterium]|jgi:FkbM family methyltransferase